MSIRKIKKYNSQTFLNDLKRVREVMVYAEHSESYFRILKKEVKELAEGIEIKYYITDAIFKVKRDVMVII